MPESFQIGEDVVIPLGDGMSSKVRLFKNDDGLGNFSKHKLPILTRG